MKKTITILAVAVLMISCSSNNDTSNTTTPQLKLLSMSKQYIASPIHNDNTVFQYSGDKISKFVSTIANGNTSTEELTYSNNKVISDLYIEKNSAGVITTQQTTNYQYSGDNIISSNTSNSHDVYTYTNGKVTNRKSYNSSNVLTDEAILEFNSAGNRQKLTSIYYGSTTQTSIINYTYDNKKSTESLMYPNELFLINSLSSNNVLTMDSSTTFEYEYNSFDYPTKITEKTNGVISEITTLTYNK